MTQQDSVAEDPLIGQQVSNCVLTQRLGQGAMGVVYEARHVTLDRRVAIKFLAAHLASDPTYVERFLREARAAARLNHANLIAVYDAGADGGIYYIVMEFVEGSDLSKLLKERQVLEEGETMYLGQTGAIALGYAHRHGIIHRDIKPQNLMLTTEGDLKVADLGLAKQLNDENASMTMSGVVMGTPYYISPEQVRGAKDIDGRADIYSLGVTLYHLVTGRVPFQGSSSAEIMSKHLTEPLPWPRTIRPDLSEGFCKLLYKMMAKDAKDRFQTMEDVAAVLSDLASGRVNPLLDDVRVAGVNLGAPSGAVDPFSGSLTVLDSSAATSGPRRVLRFPKASEQPPEVPAGSPAAPAIPTEPPSAASVVAPEPSPPVSAGIASAAIPSEEPKVSLTLKEPSPKDASPVKEAPVVHLRLRQDPAAARKTESPKTSSTSTLIKLVAVLAALGLIAGGAFYFLKQRPESVAPPPSDTAQQPKRVEKPLTPPTEGKAAPDPSAPARPPTAPTAASVEVAVKQKIEQSLGELVSKPPEPPLNGTVRFALAVNAAGEIAELKSLPADPSPGSAPLPPDAAAVVSAVEKAIRKAAPFFDKTASFAISNAWQANITVKAAASTVAVQRKFNATEKAAQAQLEANDAQLAQQIANLEAQKSRILESDRNASSKGGGGSTFDGGGAFKGDLSKKFQEKSDTEGASIHVKRQLEEMDLAIQELQGKRRRIANQLAGFQSGTVTEKKLKQEFTVQIEPVVAVAP
ncbi:MAG: protein kinase [Verrucomicrobia bacterium]|nr:protein kinase [Verrucomicrobiota bacterium]